MMVVMSLAINYFVSGCYVSKQSAMFCIFDLTLLWQNMAKSIHSSVILRAFALQSIDLSSFPGPVVPKILKRGFTSSLFDIQLERYSGEKSRKVHFLYP